MFLAAMNSVERVLERMSEMIWGPWMQCFFLGTGLVLMIRLKGLPLRRLGYGLRCAFGKEEEQETKKKSEEKSEKKLEKKSGISPFGSLMTELAASMGTGNIVGVGTAMVLGGAGALVWMVLSSFIGLATKFAESMLSVTYRVRGEDESYSGGPMYTMVKAIPNKKIGTAMAMVYAAATVLASFGMGNMTQINSAAEAIELTLGISPIRTGVILALFLIPAVMGGVRSIVGINMVLVPAMALFYFVGVIGILLDCRAHVVEGLWSLFRSAFGWRAAAGGAAGYSMVWFGRSLRYGIARGVFSNEAGLGAGGISAAASRTEDPVKQGYISMTSVFLDTAVICTLTGLAIVVSGAMEQLDGTGQPYTGAGLAIEAFRRTYGTAGSYFVTASVVLFALATVLGWSYQGETAFAFLVKDPAKVQIYRFLYGILIVVGAVCELELLWNLADVCNALMAIPNLLCLLWLSGTVVSAVIEKESEKESEKEPSGQRRKI